MGAEANDKETVDETQEAQKGQEEVPLTETVHHDTAYGWVNK